MSRVDRLELLKLLSGGATPGIPAVQSIERIVLRPTDALVVYVPGDVDQQIIDVLTANMQTVFPGHRVIVLQEGMNVLVWRNEGL